MLIGRSPSCAADGDVNPDRALRITLLENRVDSMHAVWVRGRLAGYGELGTGELEPGS
jgi:hypothetical protein